MSNLFIPQWAPSQLNSELFNFLGDTVNIGDLMWWDASNHAARPATYFTDAGNGTTQLNFAALFLGVSNNAQRSGDLAQRAKIVIDGIFEYPVTSTTTTLGDYVEPAYSVNALLSQQLAKTTNNLHAIGAPIKDYQSAATKIKVRLWSKILVAALAPSVGTTGDITVNSVTGGDSSLDIAGQAGSSSAGGAVPITGGAGNGSAQAGGAVSATGGAGGAAGTGGAVSMTGGAPASGNANGGAVNGTGGAGSGTGTGGAVVLAGGTTGGGATGTGGAVSMTGGANANATNGAGGAASVVGGAGKGTGAGGALAVTGGASAATSSGNGGAAAITGGAVGTSGTGTGGAISVAGGAGTSGGTAGSVTIDAGAANSGTAGTVSLGATNASSITIGSSGNHTVINGPTTEAIGGSTAAAGSTTTDATVLPAGTTGVYPTTAADGTKGVRMHASDKVTGRMVYIGNGVSNQILKVYPVSGGTINGASADAAFSSTSGKGVIIVCLSSGSNTWLAW